MMTKELLQQAIRALQECRGDVLSEKADDMAYKAVAALKAAIAQPEQLVEKKQRELITERRLSNLATAARAALHQLTDNSSQGQAERVALEKALIYAGFDPYGADTTARLVQTVVEQVAAPESKA